MLFQATIYIFSFKEIVKYSKLFWYQSFFPLKTEIARFAVVFRLNYLNFVSRLFNSVHKKWKCKAEQTFNHFHSIVPYVYVPCTLSSSTASHSFSVSPFSPYPTSSASRYMHIVKFPHNFVYCLIPYRDGLGTSL